jgi:UDP-N-acetylglucosamine diphosphorylase / glucose-1-phosphate thymidylyltransferase / UDP-N-acetylgalactosamine diphosphorylase / glucosamine-1-phosphate N-acetyltransferase / galactosamine-1-phosphate N-acetyltransferase
MKTAIILAAGKGAKMWPYGEVRPKCLLPVANQAVIEHQVNGLRASGVERIIVAAHHHISRIQSLFRNDPLVEIIDVRETKGSAHSLLRASSHVPDETFWVIYGDVWIHPQDIEKLAKMEKIGALVTSHQEQAGNHIGCRVVAHHVEGITGHSRGKTTHHFVGFVIHKEYLSYLETTPDFFPSVEVGMMVPEECFLEAALHNMIEDQIAIPCQETSHFCLDLDKPWHLLAVNSYRCNEVCDALSENILLEGSTIDDSAKISGFVRLGKNSSIGSHVSIEGNCWVGDDTHIKNGAFLKGNVVIGNHCEIGYGCYIEENSSIGNYCKVLHGAELSGVLFPNVYLYHYMEIAGIVGENTDIGAGTVCGSLRFDDGLAVHQVNGRKETPSTQAMANACYIGDQCRTGVNAIILPGKKVGSGSIVGPGVLLDEDLESGKVIFLQQNQVKKDWNVGKYGW